MKRARSQTEESGSPPKTRARRTQQEELEDLVIDWETLPESKLLDLLLLMTHEDCKQFCEMSPISQFLFEKFEDRFPTPPALNEKGYRFEIQAELEHGETMVKCKVEPRDTSLPVIHMENPSLARLKRYMYSASCVWIILFKLPDFLTKGTEKYNELRAHLATRESDVSMCVYTLINGPCCEDIIKIYSPRATVNLLCSRANLIDEPASLFRIKDLKIQVSGITKRNETEKLFAARQKFSITRLICEDTLPIPLYIIEWIRGERDIGVWTLELPAESGLIPTIYQRNGEVLKLERENKRNGRMVITLSSTPTAPLFPPLMH